ncbi:MAG: DUF1501 domain-containing protein [Planctomycetaceae bacterium]|nr:DUF1501 domain-containing protein [Planctomycetaceae bacterium]
MAFRQTDGWLSRRALLKLGYAAGLGCVWPSWSVPKTEGADESAQAAPGFGRAKSVIIIMASGGQSQIDSWDPKPLAPAEIRGEFGTIDTAIPGVPFCEHLPQTAKIADSLCVIKSMSHADLDHGSAFYLTMTGRYHRRRSANPLPSSEDLPCHGAVLHRVRPTPNFVQSALHLNGPAEVPNIIGPGQFGGFLGKGYDPFTVGDVTGSSIAIPSLEPNPDVTSSRLTSREQLLQRIEAQSGHDLGQMAIDKRDLYSQAFDMLQRRETRDAFDLSQESPALRERYGMNRSGQACLLSRRLVEAGVPLVTVIWNHNNRGQDLDPADPDLYGWDTHNDIFYSLKNYLLPRFDQGFSALIEDLKQRGMLDDTLVICMGEFGRAPLVALEKNFAGASPGRKHWGWGYSIVMAGAGVRGGTVVGELDSRGAYPVSESYGPWDVTATLFSALGIDPKSHYYDLQNRPYRISDGEVISAAYTG